MEELLQILKKKDIIEFLKSTPSIIVIGVIFFTIILSFSYEIKLLLFKISIIGFMLFLYHYTRKSTFCPNLEEEEDDPDAIKYLVKESRDKSKYPYTCFNRESKYFINTRTPSPKKKNIDY